MAKTLLKNLNRAMPQNYAGGLLAAFVLLSLACFLMSRTKTIAVPSVTALLPPLLDHVNVSVASGDLSISQRNYSQGGVSSEEMKRPICHLSSAKSDVCEAEGDVRIVGKDTRMVFVSPPQSTRTELANGSWTIKPYARKFAAASGAGVREVTLKLVDGYGDSAATRCTVNHSVPALVFAIGGWTGNFFHDFVDVLLPLFQTARPFAGEVQLLVANMNPAWVNKYRHFFRSLSRYELIDFDRDDAVRCFKRVTLGLRCSTMEEFQIDPSRSPQGYTMRDFARFARAALSVERERLEALQTKPRLMLITRASTRRFVNADEIADAAREAGFEVVTGEADPDVAKFARVVNSCDVVVGVHGCALTSMVFLPANAVVVQVVPWGNLGWISEHYFGQPARQMGLHYLEYNVNEEETTLSQMYARDHAVFKDPLSLHRQGWNTYARIFLREQNVRLDLKRFRPILARVLQILREQPNDY